MLTRPLQCCKTFLESFRQSSGRLGSRLQKNQIVSVFYVMTDKRMPTYRWPIQRPVGEQSSEVQQSTFKYTPSAQYLLMNSSGSYEIEDIRGR